MKKKIIAITLTILLLGSIVWVLARNKNKMSEDAERSLQVNTEIPVTTVHPEYINASNDYTITGKIVSKNEITIMPKAQGIVTVKYKSAGDHITKGDPIAKIEDDVIRESLRLAELNLAKAQKDVERYSNLYNANVITKSELESVEIVLRSAENQVIILREQLRNTTVTATSTGILEKTNFEVGSLVAPGMVMAEIVDPRNLKMTASLTEAETVRIRQGNPVKVTLNIYPGAIFNGKVDVVSSRGGASMNYEVEIVFLNDHSDRIKPGMHAEAYIELNNGNAEELLAIQRNCILGSLKNPYVYLVADGKAYRKDITVGNVYNDRVTVLNGLSVDDLVVLSGQINLRDGSTVICH